MLGTDSLHEILSTIRKNKLRTFLTGFAVAWGIFMLIVLLSAGNGFRNGFMSNMGDKALNSIAIYPGTTSKPSRGLQAGRRISFDRRDLELIISQLPEVEYISAQVGRNVLVSYGEESGAWSVYGVTADYSHIENLKMRKGRFINNVDISQKRKVIVLHPEMEQRLFGEGEGLGKHIFADNIVYTVVGVYEPSDNFSREAYMPFSTAQMIYSRGWGFGNINFTVRGLNTTEENEEFETRLRQVMGTFHGFDPTDRAALYVWSSFMQAKQIRNVFAILNGFITLIGLACMMAGIIGVGNIMLITVKERTFEIGIRKALGATPASIIRLIIFESIFITTCAGYVGILLGSGVTALANIYLSYDVQGIRIFENPTVEMGTVIRATLFLIACGAVAGLIPAWKATRVRPIEAMRAEK